MSIYNIGRGLMNRMGGLYMSIGVLLAGLHQMGMQSGANTVVFFLLFVLAPIFVLCVCVYIGMHLMSKNEHIEHNGRGGNN